MTLEKTIADPKRLADESRFYARLLAGIPSPMPPIIEWAEANVRLNGAKGEMFRIDNTPWTRLPIELCFDPEIREVTLVKPTRTGGSAAGHVVICGWSKTAMGQIQYNWPTDKKAADMWEKELENIFKRSLKISPEQKGLIKLPNCIISVQGVFAEGNLDSDTIPNQVIEEVHAWERGMLAKAYGRGDACDFPIRFNISNAGMEGDQLHQAFKDGTMRQWEVECPGCKKFHVMRVRWDERHPELGGLWYDYDHAKRADGSYDYNVIAKTIRYKMPCGHEVPDDITVRRALSAGGRYSEPFNTGARPGVESMTYQAVACHTMDWVGIIKRRNNALLARRFGDEDSYRKYVQEVECEFYSGDKIPFQGAVVLTSGAIINRTGLENEIGKIWAADWQQGFKHLGELTHYWLVIESVLANCSSQVIFADKVADEGELLTVLRQHGITGDDGGGLCDGFVDASKNTKHILSFCYRSGVNAVVGGDVGQKGFRWPDGSNQYYAMKKFIYKELNMPPKFEMILTREGYVEDPAEPFIIRYNKAGLLKNHFFIREMKPNVLAANPQATPEHYIERIVPGDIGEDYLKHHAAWERDLTAKGVKKMGEVEGFKQIARGDHLMSCSTYIDLMKDLTGLLGNRLAQLGIERSTQTEGNHENA